MCHVMVEFFDYDYDYDVEDLDNGNSNAKITVECNDVKFAANIQDCLMVEALLKHLDQSVYFNKVVVICNLLLRYSRVLLYRIVFYFKNDICMFYFILCSTSFDD